MLLISIVSLVLIIGGYLLYRFDIAGLDELWAGLSWIVGLFLAVWLLVWVGNYSGNSAHFSEYKAIQQTIETSRENGTTDVERATLIGKIIEENEWLAGCNYWNGTFVGDMIPDKITELKPIQ